MTKNVGCVTKNAFVNHGYEHSIEIVVIRVLTWALILNRC